MNTESNARALAEVALIEHGWKPLTPGCWWDGELAVGRSHDDKYEVSLWDFPEDEPEMPWRCDVGVTPPDSEKEALWLLGIPRPEEVPALLERHADILSAGHEGRTLDLATGTVFLEGHAGVAAIVAEAQMSIAEREDILREVVAAGWFLRYVAATLRGVSHVHRVGASGTSSHLDSFEMPVPFDLHVDFWRGGISEIWVEEPIDGIAVPVGKETIPTPDEAYEAYYREISRGEIVTREVLDWEPRHGEDTTQ